jgi:raffinose/stachyose/melibiose transport system permease protein
MWLYLVPALIINVSVILIPAILTVLLAFTEWDGMGSPTWIGMENILTLIQDPTLWQSLVNNIVWTGMFLTIPVAIGLLMAALLLQIRGGQDFFQVVFFVPFILATVVISRVWQGMIYSPVTGIFGLLGDVGVNIPNPLSKPGLSLYGVAAVDMWHWWGFLTVVFFAALRQIDQDYLDAAKVAGATFFQQFRMVLIPLIKPTVVFMMIMTIIWSFIVFDFIYVLTEGGPGTSSEVLATFAYKEAFFRFSVGRASAISFVMGLLGLGAISAYLWMQTREETI